jgi:hypothetical protein
MKLSICKLGAAAACQAFSPYYTIKNGNCMYAASRQSKQGHGLRMQMIGDAVGDFLMAGIVLLK